jgi:hypothetical protein
MDTPTSSPHYHPHTHPHSHTRTHNRSDPQHLHQGHLLLEGACNQHILNLTCANTSSNKPTESPKPDNKPKKLINLEVIALLQQEADLKLSLYKELHQFIQAEKIDVPVDLAKKIKLPDKQIKAIYEGNLQALNLFQLLSANTQLGYNIIICLRANQGYLPGKISLET